MSRSYSVFFLSIICERVNVPRLPRIHFLVLLFICCSISGLAQESVLRRHRQGYVLRGYVEPSYRYFRINAAGVTTSTSILTEDLRADVRGYILDYRLFSFRLGSSLTNNDRWFSSYGYARKSSGRSVSLYNFTGTILPQGRHPLSFFSSYHRGYSTPAAGSEVVIDSRVTGGALALNYSSIPKLSISLNRSSTKSASSFRPRDRVNRFFEITARQNWESISRLKASYRAEDQSDRLRGTTNSTRLLRLDGQTRIQNKLFLNGLLGYYQFNQLETISANTRFRFNPTRRFSANLSGDFAEETDESRWSRRHAFVFFSQGWVNKSLQLNYEMSGNRSTTQADSLTAMSSDFTLTPGYYLAFSVSEYRFVHSYSFGYGHHVRSDSAKGRSLSHNVSVSVSRVLAKRLNMVNSYSFSTSEADYIGGISITTHVLSSNLDGRVSRKLRLRSRGEYTRYKSSTDALTNRRTTYRGELEGFWALSWRLSSTSGLRYRREQNDRKQDIITVFSKVRYFPTNRLSVILELSHNHETIDNSSESASYFSLDYAYRNLTLFVDWKLRHYSNQGEFTSHEFYIKVRRSFDIRLRR